LTTKGKLPVDEIIQLKDKSIIHLFTKSFNEIEVLIISLQNKKLNAKTKTGLMNYIIIRLISLIESFCKNLTRKIIDEYQLEPRGIFEKDEVKISIFDLEKIKKNRKVTLGRIISNEINFQNPKEIDFAISKLIGTSFFEQVSERAKLKMFTKTINGVDYFFNWNDFYQLFEERNKIVHEVSNANVDLDKIMAYYTNSLLFLSYALSITTDKAKEIGKIKL